jgi:hypothetical protein
MIDSTELSCASASDWLRVSEGKFVTTYLPPDLAFIRAGVSRDFPLFGTAMTQDDEDRRTLEEAADRYEGKDWRAAFKPLG